MHLEPVAAAPSLKRHTPLLLPPHLWQEYAVKSGAGFGGLPKNLMKAWGQLRCDSVLCEPLRPRDQAAARAGERFPCKRRFWDDVMKFPPVAQSADGKKKKKKKRVQIK